MSRKFNIIKNYYDEDVDLYKKKAITINEGITVLVGCNGIGKTTLLRQMKYELKKKNIPCISFDNLHDGGQNSISKAGFHADYGFMATALQSSEGENIIMNLGKLAARLGDFVREGNGDDEDNKRTNDFADAMKKAYAMLNDETLETSENTNETDKDNDVEKDGNDERWILLDAIDSGLSVDNIVDVKEDLFATILEYNYGKKIYIVVSANEYEMARNEQCFDVYNGKYVTFKDYEEYRTTVLSSRLNKEKR